MADIKKRPGCKRIYVRDTLAKNKRGKNAIKQVEKIRVQALRKKSPNALSLKKIENKNAERPLTDKQRMFVRFWAAGETPRTAAIMAGYAETSTAIGWRLSADPAILKIYNEEKKLYLQASQMTRQKVMDMLKDAYDMAKIQSDPAVMVAAAREIGKMCGFYAPDVSINVNVGGHKLIEQMNSLSDEELLKIAEDGGDIIPGESIRIDEPAALPAPA